MKALVFVTALLVAGVASAACKEGSRGYITKYDSAADKEVKEARTCVNGTFMNAQEKAAYVYNPKTTCVEGARSFVTLHDASGDHSYTEVRTCVNGSYMTAAERAAYVRVPKNTCKEGATKIETVHSDDDRSAQVRKVCQAGKWITAGN